MTSKRLLKPASKSFFLFGPRATGKSTWLKKQVKADLSIDLLKASEYQKYSKNISLLREVLEANPNYKTIVIDEIQKLPELLDEVHSLIFDFNNKHRFILTGSSARKLKKKNVNLLAGRALLRNFHTYSCLEVAEHFNIDQALKFGMLPEVWNIKDEADKKDYLISYVQTYLKEEIQQEAAVRSLPSYLSFLEHFAIKNGQVINLQNLSGDIGVARTTIISYLEILEHTLLGFKLLPIHLKAKAKEVSLPKFYFFDTGVVRALSQSLDNTLAEDKGYLLETFILNELKIYSDYNQKRWEFYYWGTPSLNEVDFIVARGKTHIGIEVKSAKIWKSEFSKGLKTLLDSKKIVEGIGIYCGDEIIKKDGITIYPVAKFVEALHKNKFLKV